MSVHKIDGRKCKEVIDNMMKSVKPCDQNYNSWQDKVMVRVNAITKRRKKIL